MPEETPKPPEEMTDLELLQELGRETCRCGNPKQKGKTFCTGCYFRLPKHFQTGLYSQFGKGYREAYTAATLKLEWKGKHL